MHIVIIGNGISGVTAARHLRKLGGHRITIVSDENPHFFSRTALMYIYMGHMRYEDVKPYEDWFWEKNRIGLMQDRVIGIQYNQKKIKLRNNTSIEYDKLIIAVGSRSNKFNWPGQDLEGVSGLYHLQDLQHMEEHSKGLKRAVVVGGGLIGIEMAEMFHSRHIPVTMLVRESSYWNNVLPPEESAMVSSHIRDHGIDLRLNSNLKEIIDDGDRKAAAVVIAETGERIDCGYVGLTAGVRPNIDFLGGHLLETERGILVNEYLETNIENVYAIGDCAQIRHPGPGRKAIEAVWYTGRMMGESVAKNIMGKREPYDPGIWFNSAKFMDIEYQIYGQVPTIFDGQWASIYWEHPEGRKSIRLVFDSETRKVVGFNLMGIRYRHEVCEQWIREGIAIDKVLMQIRLANFDPEFYKTYESELVATYNRQHRGQVQLKEKGGLSNVLSFLK